MDTDICINGRIVKRTQAMIPAVDHAVLYGKGLFETLRSYDYIPFKLNDHLKRMKRSANVFDIPYARSHKQITNDIARLLKRNRTPNRTIRITLTSGSEHTRPILLITTRPLPPRTPPAGGTVILCPWKRQTDSPLAGHKTLNYLEHMLLREEALERGAIDGLLINERNEILEGSATNVFIVKRGRVSTPPTKSSVLPGITRKIIITICRQQKIPLNEQIIHKRNLLAADEVFITNSLIEVVPVRKVERSLIAKGSLGLITKCIATYYQKHVQRYIKRRLR